MKNDKRTSGATATDDGRKVVVDSTSVRPVLHDWSIGANIPAYLQIVSIWIQTTYTYRVNQAFELLGILLRVYLLKVIWTAVYNGRGVVNGIELREVIAFITLAQLQVWVMFPIVAPFIRDRVRDGQIALDLARPQPFFQQLLAHQVGATASWIPFLLLALPFGFVLGGVVPPVSFTATLLYLISLTLAYLISFMLGMIIGLVSFWTLQIRAVLEIYDFGAQFFTGAMIPLAFFPPFLRRVADLLPFQAQAYIPLSIYMGQLPMREIPGALGLQLVWVIILFALASLMWRHAMRRIIIQGG